MKKKLFILIFLVILVVGAIALVGCGESASDGKVKVGIIYIGEPGDAGWTYTHDQGIKAAVKAIGADKVELITQTNVKEDKSAEQAMEVLIKKGCSAIFATSYGYMDYCVNLAKKYPDVKFFHCSGYKTATNLSTYMGAAEQARYLTGIAAGMETKSNKIGYVAAMPIPEVIRGINGFTEGVRSVNPNATVQVIWTNTWYDPQKEKDSATALLDKGCDVIAQHQDTPGPQTAAQEKGKMAIGYNSDMQQFAPKATITSAVFNWEVYYEPAIRSVIDKTFKSQQYYGGLKEGVVDYAPLNKGIMTNVDGVQGAINKAKADIIGGKNIFTGPIKDNTGKEQIKAGSAATHDDLMSMNYFVEGVDGTIPAS